MDSAALSAISLLNEAIPVPVPEGAPNTPYRLEECNPWEKFEDSAGPISLGGIFGPKGTSTSDANSTKTECSGVPFAIDVVSYSNGPDPSKPSLTEIPDEPHAELTPKQSGPVVIQLPSNSIKLFPSNLENGNFSKNSSHWQQICDFQRSASRHIDLGATPSQAQLELLQPPADPSQKRRQPIGSKARQIQKIPGKATTWNAIGPLAVIPAAAPIAYETMEGSIMNYVNAHNLDGLFEYLLALISIHMPEDPYCYIARVTSEMIDARCYGWEEDVSFERVFNCAHVDALYRLLDRDRKGHINKHQYKNGMESLGLTQYAAVLHESTENEISPQDFVSTAVQSLNATLRPILECGVRRSSQPVEDMRAME